MPVNFNATSRELDLAENQKRWAEEEEKREEEIKSKVSAPGAFRGISPLLEERRLHYRVPDSVIKFAAGCPFDRVAIYQLAQMGLEEGSHVHKIAGTDKILYKGERVARKDREQSPRGLLVGAGLGALDVLLSNGIEVGHVVLMQRLAPWRVEVDTLFNTPVHVFMSRDGDINSSYDLADALISGEASVQATESDGVWRHHYVDKNGKHWLKPQLPWIPEEQ